MRIPLLLLFFTFPVSAQSITIPLWENRDMPGPAPMVDGKERDITTPGDKLIAGRPVIRLGHVSNPEIEIHLPSPENRNGTAVVICPGGGFSLLAWDLEGTEVAEWLNSLGVAAIVLKYRVPTREHGDEGEIAPPKALGPMMDAQRAVSATRNHAAEWQIDPDRIGILGFSAGGQTAALVATHHQRSYPANDAVDQSDCRVNFGMLIYPGGLANADGTVKSFFKVDHETPSMFLVHTADDHVTPLASSAMFNALEQAGVPTEIHIFSRGGHGYGLRSTQTPVSRWPNLAEDWLREMGLLERIDNASTAVRPGHENSIQGSEERVLPVARQYDRFAQNLADLSAEGKALPQFSVRWPEAPLADAVTVQKAFVAALQDRKTFAGIKGAVVGSKSRELFGIDKPLTAVLFREGWHDARDRPEIEIFAEVEPGIETELGIIIGSAILSPVGSVEALKKRVRAIVPVVELPSGRHDWPQKPTAADLTAVNVDSDRYIVGEPIRELDLDLESLPIRLLSGDKILNETTGGDAAGKQWPNFLHQVNEAISRGYQLSPGDLVITGALGTISRNGPGQYRATFGDAGTIEFTLSLSAD